MREWFISVISSVVPPQTDEKMKIEGRKLSNSKAGCCLLSYIRCQIAFGIEKVTFAEEYEQFIKRCQETLHKIS